jgi:AraC-like DNA-binding protein
VAELGAEARVSLLLVDRWVDRASRQLRDPVLGLNALSELRRGGEDIVLLAAECAPTFRDALLTFIRYAQLLCEAADLHLHVHRGLASVSLRYALELSPVTRDFLIGALMRALQSSISGAPRLELWLSGVRPRRAPVYDAVFAPLRVEFGSTCDAIVFSDALLNAPCAKANTPVHRALLRAADQLVLDMGRPGSFADRVRRQVSTSLAGAGGCVYSVSRAMGVSGRTLARRLNEEGTTFSLLLDEVRIECARYYLERSDLGPKEISRLLGYSCTATFCRAFQRWHGTTPRNYRRAHRVPSRHSEE